MKRIITSIAVLAILCGCAEKTPSIKEISDNVFDIAACQFKALDSQLTDDTLPKTVDTDGNLVTDGIRWWCSGFFGGSLWFVYEYTGDETFKDLAIKNTEKLRPLLEVHTDHDLGFQTMCSFGNGYRLTGDASYAEQILKSAEKLAGRYSPVTKTTRSWDNNRWEYPVIIDNMMNLEIFMKADELGGDGKYTEIAKNHANTTMENHFRDDWSTWHLVNYDPNDGHVLGKQTVQGYSDDSAWARGQAWGLYGYTMMYRCTSDEKYLNQAENIAKMLIGRLPEDGIPYWDFDDPNIPDVLRDASAGAIMASALVELSTLTKDSALSGMFLGTAEKQIRTLASDEYLAKKGENAGFLLKHSVGNLPGNGEVDVPLTYADYFFLEALLRHGNLQ